VTYIHIAPDECVIKKQNQITSLSAFNFIFQISASSKNMGATRKNIIKIRIFLKIFEALPSYTATRDEFGFE